jgi:aryl-alcohol dehydrogenase-like predicted oxidoreductase
MKRHQSKHGPHSRGPRNAAPLNRLGVARTRREVLSALALGLSPLSCLGRESDSGGPGSGGFGTGGSGSGGVGSGGIGSGGVGSGGAPLGTGGGVGSGGAWSIGRDASDLVNLGSTGIKVSRLAMGSGTHGNNGSSDQTRLGAAFPDLLVQSYDRGLTFWETADQYGAHGQVRTALEQVGRQNVVVMTKTHATTREEMQADLERFMSELGTDYLDIVLLHNRQSGTWTSDCAGAMEFLSEAKEKGDIRAHGVSCHTLQALELAANTPWVDVDLARVNPFGLHMDADPATVISVLERMKTAGKGVIGMKILGQGDATDRFDQAIEHAVNLAAIDAFTMGFTSTGQLDQVREKIAAM